MRLTLTDRQMEVLRLSADGWTAKEIGARLGITERTAKAHLDVLRQKLGVPRARELGRKAKEMELI